MKRSLAALVGILSMALMACGSGSSGNSSAVKASCMSYCDAYIQKACDNSFYASVTECKTQECDPLGAGSSACLTALTTYYDCRKGQADLCADNGCDSQSQAFVSACAK
jgi:hypothetical protein